MILLIKNIVFYIVYIVCFILKISLYTSQKTQISLLNSEKITIFIQYINFAKQILEN